MENAFAKPTEEVLSTLGVQSSTGLTDAQVQEQRKKHGKNGEHPQSLPLQTLARGYSADAHHEAIPEEPPTPLWELILEQFKDQLVIILLGSAAISFVLALFEDEGGWSAFVDPIVVRSLSLSATHFHEPGKILTLFGRRFSQFLS